MLGFVGTREWVYAQTIDGRFQRIRRWTFLALHLFLFVTPWVRIAGNPALRLDLPGRRLYAFGGIFTASDAVLLLLVLLFLAFSLFFFTALFGRLWCGYGCPQTVLLESWIRPIERWIEGEHTTRRRRDAGPWTRDRAARKAAKWSLFAAAAVVVSMSFMGFFEDPVALWTGRAGPVDYSLVSFFAGAWFLDFTWFREQFCNFLCPYARFQSVMADDHTLLIAYDAARGEPRGGKQAKLDGRCVDCRKCVNVCPQGIDIRNGFQLECIGCARCIDACTSVMDVLGHGSLVGYGSLVQLAGKRSRRVRPRTLVYGGVLAAVLLAGVLLVATRVPFEAAVTRAPGSLFTVDPDGFVRNTYLLRIANNAPGEAEARLPFRVGVEGLPGAEVVLPAISLHSTESQIVPLVVRIPADSAAGRTLPMRVHVAAPTGERVIDTTFKTGGADVVY